MTRSLLFAAILGVLPHVAAAQSSAEKCFTDGQAWTPPVGLTSVKRVVVVGGGAAGGADNAGDFGMGGQAAPNGGATGGTGWGAGGGAGTGGGGGQAGVVTEQVNVAVSGPVAVTVGDRGTTAGANGSQSCFGATCAAGGIGGGAFHDFSAVGGGQAGWGGASGTGTKTSPTQDLGTVYTGQTSSTKTITVVNNSGTSSTFQSVTAPSNVNISSDSCSSKVIAKGGSCTFNVSISPTSAGVISRTIPVRTDRGLLNVAVRATAETPPTCNLPWGGTIQNGQSVTAYAASWVSYGGSCSAQTRTCSNGTLTGSYTNSSCSVEPGASCSLPWGGSVGDGGSVYAYQASSGTSCSGQWRYCSNGSLSGSYSSPSCSVITTGTWGPATLQMDYSCHSWSPATPAASGSCSPIGSTHTYYSYGLMSGSCYAMGIWTQTCQ